MTPRLTGLPEAVNDDLEDLFYSVYDPDERASDPLGWYYSFVHWQDTGEMESLCALVAGGGLIPDKARSALAYVLGGGKRGVKRKHQNYTASKKIDMRGYLCRKIKEDLRKECDSPNEAINQRVADTYNAQYMKLYAYASIETVKKET